MTTQLHAVGRKHQEGITGSPPAGPRLRIVPILIVYLSLATTLWFALTRGQDLNWDQRNYHIGIPLLLSTGRFWNSVAPAGVVSYLNPYVLQAQFWALRHLSPTHFVILLASLQSLAFMLAGAICHALTKPAEGRWRWPLSLLGFGLSLMAPMAVSEDGTTFIDLLTAIPVLAAYLLLLTRMRRFTPVHAALLAGALLGCAVALKLTNAVFALGVVGFAVAGPDPARQRVLWLAACTGAALVAYLAIALPWDIALWRHFGNPIFPFFNSIFDSPNFPAIDFHDKHFAVRSVFDIWFYPLVWARPSYFHAASIMAFPNTYMSYTSSEVPYADGRWFVAIVGNTLFLAALAIRRRWGAQRLRDPATGLLFAFAIDYLAWLFVFDVGRYAVVLSILCGAVILVLVMTLPAMAWRAAILGLMVIAQGYLAVVPNWGHVAWQPVWQAFVRPKLSLGERPLVFLAAQPTLFLAASLPPDALYVGITGPMDLSAAHHDVLTEQIRKDLTWAGGEGRNLYSVDDGRTSGPAARFFSSYGLLVSGSCTPVRVATLRLRICKLQRVGRPTVPASPG